MSACMRCQTNRQIHGLHEPMKAGRAAQVQFRQMTNDETPTRQVLITVSAHGMHRHPRGASQLQRTRALSLLLRTIWMHPLIRAADEAPTRGALVLCTWSLLAVLGCPVSDRIIILFISSPSRPDQGRQRDVAAVCVTRSASAVALSHRSADGSADQTVPHDRVRARYQLCGRWLSQTVAVRKDVAQPQRCVPLYVLHDDERSGPEEARRDAHGALGI
jgi:hypothetical protein